MGRQKRVEKFHVRSFRNPGGTIAWRVSGSLKGKRIRENYQTKAEALERRGMLDLEALEIGHPYRMVKTHLTTQQVAEAEAAVALIGSIPLGKAVADYVRVRKAVTAKGATLDEALQFLNSHYREELEELTILEACRRFMEGRRALGLAKATLNTYEATLTRLYRPDPERRVSQFSPRDLSHILSRYRSLSSKRSMAGRLSTFFGWAVRFRHALENPCDRLDKLPPDTSKIQILSCAEAGRVLRAAMAYDNGRMVPVAAIALFAGLRPSEINSLATSDFRNGRIRVRGGKLRRITNRMVPIPANLRLWLDRYPFTGTPVGQQYGMRKLKEAAAAPNWVNDILRHTSISFQIERDKNDALVALNCGTSLKMINRHYREVIEDPAEVAAFWDLTPDTVLKDVVIETPMKRKKKVAWPSDRKLAEMVATLPMTRIGEQLGCSDNAVRKRLRKRGLAVAAGASVTSTD